jgi:4-hydroxy-tetrahydrodipicolinate synthase
VDDEGLYRWFSEVVEAVGSNIGSVILYHIPALTQIELSVELVLRLSEAFPGVVVAVK